MFPAFGMVWISKSAIFATTKGQWKLSSIKMISLNAVRRLVPNDNNCLFAAFVYLCGGKHPDESEQQQVSPSSLREICAQTAVADPDPATRSLYLGMEVQQYASWIKNSFNWGGENEIIVLANHFGVEVAVVSCESLSMMVYGSGNTDGRPRVYLLYTGQHYDPIVAMPSDGDTGDTSTEIKEINPASQLDANFELAVIGLARIHNAEQEKKMNERRVKRIKCSGCSAICDDTAAFQEHCMSVEHDDDFAYDCDEIEIVECATDEQPEDRLDLSADTTLTFYNLDSIWVSPKYPASFHVDDHTFPTVEHYLQWARFHEQDSTLADSILRTTTGDLAAVVAVQGYDKQRVDWDAVKQSILEKGIAAVVQQHAGIAAQLRDTGTGTIVLIDADPWAGVQAGDGIPTGRNHVGKAWMKAREALPAS